MASRKGKSPTLSNQSEKSFEVLKELNAKLCVELSAEQNALKDLRREKAQTVNHIQEHEQHKYNIALKDLKAKLHAGKLREMELQKEALLRKNEFDLHKVTKQRDLELSKLQGDLRKCQDELRDVNRRGLSGTARGTFEAERTKMLREVQELRKGKKTLEDCIQTTQEAEKQKSFELRNKEDEKNSLLAKQKKEYDVEIRKLLDEIRRKTRTISQLQQELGSSSETISKLQQDKKEVQEALNTSKEQGLREKLATVKDICKTAGVATLTLPTLEAYDVQLHGSNQVDSNGQDSSSKVDNNSLQQKKVTELLNKLNEQCTSLTQDKHEMQRRFQELGKKHRVSQERNRLFHDKNMQLNSCNRHLEERVKQLMEDNAKLGSQLEQIQANQDRLEEQLSGQQTDRQAYDQMLEEVVSLKQAAEKQSKGVTALEKTCAEKDRRIELMVHRQKKQNMDRTGPEEKMSMEEYEKNYQRFAREHLELERKFAMLQNYGQTALDNGNSTETNIKEANAWIVEKDELNNRVKLLREKLGQKAEAYTELQLRQEELEEQTETLEFRLLELQDNDDNDKCQTNEQWSQTEADLAAALRRHQSSQTHTDLGTRVQELETEITTLRDSLSQYQSSDGYLADKNVSLMETVDSLRAKNQTLVDDYELLKYTVLKLATRVGPHHTDEAKGAKGARERSAEAEREEVEEELERALSSLRTKAEEQEDVAKRLRGLLEESEATVAECRRESEERSQLVTALRQQVRQLEGSVSSSHHSVSSDGVPALEESKEEAVQQSAESADHLKAEVEELAELRDQVKQLEQDRRTLEDRVQELQSIAEEDHHKSDDLAEKVRVLETTNKSLDQQVIDLSQQQQQPANTKDLENSIKQLDDQEKTLQARILELEAELDTSQEKEKKVQEALEELKEEKTQRVESLQEQLARMQENEIRLSETIVELEEVEEDLRKQIKDNDSTKQSEDASVDEALLSKLKASEQNLKDQVEQMEHNEKLLKEHLSEMEEQQQKMSAKDKIRELEDKVKELSEKEASLLEDVYQMKLENQELQEHVDELLADADDKSEKSDASSPRASNKSEIIQQLNDTVSQLQDENSELKDQLLRSKLDAMETIQESGEFPEGVESITELVERIQQLEDKAKEHQQEAEELADKIKAMEDGEQKLVADLKEKESKETQLLKKVEVLELSEEKLMQQVDVLYESEAKYKEQLETVHKQDTETKTVEMQAKEKELTERLASLKEAKQKLESEAKQGKSESKEIFQLRQKVDILLDTEEKLLDRLQRQELVERELHKELEQAEEEVEELEKENEELENKLASADKQAKELTDTLQEQHITVIETTPPSNSRYELLEESMRTLEAQIKVLEETKAELITKLSDAEEKSRVLEDALHKVTTSIDDDTAKPQIEERLEHSNRTLETHIQQLEESEASLQSRLTTAEKTTQLLCKSQEKVDELEKRNKALMDVISVLKTAASQKQERHTNNIDNKDQVKDNSKMGNGLPESLLMDTLPPYTPLEPNQLDRMSHEEMRSKIMELEQMEAFHRAKIGELSGNLGTLRQAVEVVAITLETDADIPVVSVRSKGKDWKYESKVQDLVKTEMVLKLKVLELQKKEAILRSQLQEAELTLKEQESDFKEELDILEDEIHKLRKSESRLKNQRKYGAHGVSESASLARIQELDGLVHDLQASEAKLKRQSHDLQRSQVDLRTRLERAEGLPLVDHLGNLRSVEDKDKYYSLLQELKELEYSEKALKSQLTDTEAEEGSKGELTGRISELERAERMLKRKLEQLESQEMDGLMEEEMMMLDSPEAILQHRIREMEKMEKHLKNQVVELERDREELHEIARKDKVHIHELTVHLRQLQLSEKNLKQQLHSVETKETHLNLKVDDLTDHIEDLEDSIKTLEASERCLKVRLHKQVYNEEDLNFKLETTKEDFLSTETKLKKKKVPTATLR